MIQRKSGPRGPGWLPHTNGMQTMSRYTRQTEKRTASMTDRRWFEIARVLGETHVAEGAV